MENIYSLDGRVLLVTSIPFGLQHVPAMFVANGNDLIDTRFVFNSENGCKAES